VCRSATESSLCRPAAVSCHRQLLFIATKSHPSNRSRTCIRGTRSTDLRCARRIAQQLGPARVGEDHLRALPSVVKIWDHNSLGHSSVVNTSAARRPAAVPLMRRASGWTSNLRRRVSCRASKWSSCSAWPGVQFATGTAVAQRRRLGGGREGPK
jgi:hypothetical protein